LNKLMSFSNILAFYKSETWALILALSRSAPSCTRATFGRPSCSGSWLITMKRCWSMAVKMTRTS